MPTPPIPPPGPPLEPPPSFSAAAEAMGIVFDPGDLERLGGFLALMLETNKTTNLTAIREPEEAWTKHILDALSLVPVLAALPTAEGVEGSGPGPSVIDVGSGGGVPALPLAIVMPACSFTLVEATGKKADFLRAAAQSLGLTNVTVINGRAEALGQDHRAHRERYDAATARALGHLAVVAELCAPLVKPHGMVVAVKGAKAEQELAEAGAALGVLGLRHAETIATGTGRLVVLEKTTRTPRSYPRRDGEPARSPLGVGTKVG